MRKLLLLCGALLALAASAAAAAGINLSYDDCGTFGTETRTFACDTNAGTNTMIGSYVAPGGMRDFVGVESEIEIQTDSPTLPEWWKFKTAGSCRQTSLTVSGDGPVPNHCNDFYGGVAGSSTVYEVAFHGPNRSRIKLVVRVNHGFRGELFEYSEYFAYKASFNNMSSTGTGSCAGCAIGACINIRYIKLLQNTGVNDDRILTNPVHRAYVRWQSASDASCIGATPARARTWGALKALYR